MCPPGIQHLSNKDFQLRYSPSDRKERGLTQVAHTLIVGSTPTFLAISHRCHGGAISVDALGSEPGFPCGCAGSNPARGTISVTESTLHGEEAQDNTA